MQFYGKMRQNFDEPNKDITINQGYKVFQNYNVAKNLSEKSIEHYAKCFKCFQGFYDTSKSCYSVTEDTIFEYIRHLKTTRNVNDITINSKLRVIRTMLYYFMKQGYMRPFQISELKAVKKIKETYTEHELTLLLKKPDINKTSFAEYRNWVLLNYFLGTGNRIGTVCNIKIDDVDFENDVIRLCKTKNRREQIIPLSSSLKQILQEYLCYRKGEADDYLFCGVSGEQITENTIRIAIYRYNRERGVMKTSVHLFRHTFAKQWILNGGDVFRLQKLLGHSNMNIVREYVNMFSDDLKQDFDEFSPLEKFHKQNGLIKKKSQFTKSKLKKTAYF